MPDKQPKNNSTQRVGERVIQHVDFIRQLAAPHKPSALSSEIREELIRVATPEQLLALVECCFNILRSRVSLTSSQLHRLNRQADQIRSLSRVRSPASARRILLRSEAQRRRRRPQHKEQRGHGLPLVGILPPLASLISSVIFPLIASSINN
jgi:hypothetical protein